MNKDLKDKAVDIKGKKYVLVADRILYFNESYPKGAIETEIFRYENGQVIVKATVYPDGHGIDHQRFFVGHSQARENDGYINKTSALENAETSAVGRALAMMGIGVIDSVASVDEMTKAGAHKPESDPLRAVRLPHETEAVKPAVTSPAPLGQEEQLARDVDEALGTVNPLAGTVYHCNDCGEVAEMKSGVNKLGKPYKGIFCSAVRTHVEWI